MEEWFEYQGQFYHFNTTTSEGQVGAERDCSQLGAYLASITSRSIEDFLDEKIEAKNIANDTKCLWIGLQNVTGNWEWENGEKLKYGNWYNQTEPNLLDSQKCANKHIQGDYRETKPWFNGYCDENGQECGRICQKTADGFPVTVTTTDGLEELWNTTRSFVTKTSENRFFMTTPQMTNAQEEWNTTEHQATAIPSSDSHRLTDDGNTIAFAISLPALIIVLLIVGFFMFYAHQRKTKYDLESHDDAVCEEKELTVSEHKNGHSNHPANSGNSEKSRCLTSDDDQDLYCDGHSSIIGSQKQTLDTPSPHDSELGGPLLLSAYKVGNEFQVVEA